MRVVVQRVTSASVQVDNHVVGSIEHGLFLLVGITHGDTKQIVDAMVHKVTHLRIFDDENGVMNESVIDQQLSVLSVSQFTLYADSTKGHRPSYIHAAKPEWANELYTYFNQQLAVHVPVETGVFGVDMKIQVTLDGPVTIHLEKN